MVCEFKVMNQFFHSCEYNPVDCELGREEERDWVHLLVISGLRNRRQSKWYSEE